MRTVALVGTRLAAAPLLLPAGQLRREPLIIATPFGVLNPAGSPIELAEGTISIVQGRSQLIRLRSKVPMLPMTGIVVRVAAGLFDDGMVTYRLHMTDAQQSASPAPERTGWTVRLFVMMPGDPAPDFSRVGRQTKFLVTVEKVSDVTGKVVFDNSDAREQLWRALGGDGK
jgi:hypothetical protein